MPCKHWLCSPCLEKRIQQASPPETILCPSCNAPAHLPPNGFPAAFLLNQLNELALRSSECPAQTQNIQCTKHQKACDMFCSQCTNLVCGKCCATDHKAHPKLPLEEMVKEHRENVRHSHDEFASKLTEFEKSLSELHKAKVECQAEAEAAKHATQKQADDFMKILKSVVVKTHQVIRKFLKLKKKKRRCFKNFLTCLTYCSTQDL